MQAIKRGIIYLIIIVGTMLIVNATRPKPEFTPHGSALPLHKKPLNITEKTSPDNIRDFRVPPPVHYQKIAKIYVQTHFIKSSPEVEKNTRNKANQLASDAGANAFIIETIGQSASNPNDPLNFLHSRFILSGTAIHLDSSQKKGND